MIARPIGWLALAAMPAYVGVLVLAIRGLRLQQYDVMESFAQLESSYIDALGGVRDIIGYRASDVFARATSGRYELFQNAGARLGNVEARIDLTSDLAGGALVVVGLTWGALLITRGGLQLGELMAGYSLLAGMLPNVSRLLLSSIPLRGAEVASARLMDRNWPRV